MIAVNEIYGPVKQGEGKSAGKDVMFLRLSGCNLACIWCDTPYTWNWKGTKFLHPDKYDPKEEVRKSTVDEVFELLLKRGVEASALVISGGEPLLQQKRLVPLLKKLKQNGWWIEVETNGTIYPEDEFAKYIDQFNCSPKTENSGPDNPAELRLIPSVLERIANFGDIATFKFVVQSELDLVEIKQIISLGKIQAKQVWLMPEGRTKEEQLERQSDVVNMCAVLGYNFSPRLHILEFGNKRAV